MKGINMSLSFGTEVIYDNAEFQISKYDKTALVGVNGAGKTTLFKIILKEEYLDSGYIDIEKANIAYLPQEIIIDDENIIVLDYLSEVRPIKELEEELSNLYEALAICSIEEQDNLLRKVVLVQDKLDALDYYDSKTILDNIIEQMKIKPEMLTQKMSELSGGQKSKIAFARILYSKSDILLLDEPTNHLDYETKDFICNYLKNYKGMVLLISHDVDFINKIVNKVMYLNKSTHKIYVFEGDYNNYLKRYDELKESREKQITLKEKEIKELSSFVLKAQQASRTNHHLKRVGLERAERLEKKIAELETHEKKIKYINMNLSPRFEGARIPLEVMNLSFHYPNNDYLYENLSFEINKDERFLIVGENGMGKSTLLKLIMGKLNPNSGKIFMNEKTDFSYYAQELELLNMKKNLIDNIDYPEYSHRELRSMLSNFLFYGDDVFKKVGLLSPGEKARLSLCKILLQKPNFLFLDEPTNHLDPETQKMIAKNFKNFNGTIMVVSHNMEFVEAIGITRMLILPTGKIENYSSEKMKYYNNKKD